MGLAQLRKYHRETYNPETGYYDYTVIEEIQISEEGLNYLTTPEDGETSFHEWVYLGTRAEQLSGFYDDEWGFDRPY